MHLSADVKWLERLSYCEITQPVLVNVVSAPGRSVSRVDYIEQTGTIAFDQEDNALVVATPAIVHRFQRLAKDPGWDAQLDASADRAGSKNQLLVLTDPDAARRRWLLSLDAGDWRRNR